MPTDFFSFASSSKLLNVNVMLMILFFASFLIFLFIRREFSQIQQWFIGMLYFCVVRLQGFVAQEAHLKELSFAFQPVDDLPQDTSVQFELLNSQSRVLVSKLYTAADIMDENYCTVTINKWLKKGDIYAYTLTVSGNKSFIYYFSHQNEHLLK